VTDWSQLQRGQSVHFGSRTVEARRLWLIHFGPSLEVPAAHLRRATAIFSATVIGHEGLTETLIFEEE
jgi:hypothetical protein